VTGNLGTADAVRRPPRPASRKRQAPARLRAYWSTPTGKIVVAATVVAVAIRLFTFTRPGYLAGITEYDDGVYLGATIRLVQGHLPYRDFAFIQPPGILLLTLPAAVAASMTTTVKALALARVATALASAACVPLAGNLTRYRGPVATLVACAFLAIYPDDVSTAHTLMLEPWMNLLCLLAVSAAFRDGRLARPRPSHRDGLTWAGLLMGLAGTVKFWAAVPAAVLLAACLLARDQRAGRARSYVTGLAAGFVVPLAPFALAAPVAMVRATLTDQAARAGSPVPTAVRLAHLTGLIDVLNVHGHYELAAGAASMYASGSSAPLDPGSGLGWLPYLAAAAGLALVIAGYGWRARVASAPTALSPLEWFAAATAAVACAAVLGYSAFFYHYADFPAPWLALTAGGAAAALARLHVRKTTAVVTAAFALVAALQVREVRPMTQAGAQAVAREIPKGACVVTDEVSLTIAADRFTGYRANCPVIVDSLAQTLVLSNGVSVQGGAATMPKVVAAWRTWLGEADYVWLTPGTGPGLGSARRIPWTPALLRWFHREFRRVGSYSRSTGQLYKRERVA
jgi:hypothetical protein